MKKAEQQLTELKKKQSYQPYSAYLNAVGNNS